jgi:deoxyribodipyrimidine photo-lyase
VTFKDTLKMPIVNRNRVIKLNHQPLKTGPVVYWMFRDQRLNQNWALLRAQELALDLKQPLIILIAIKSDLSKNAGTARWFYPMAEGLQQVAIEAQKRGVSLAMLVGDPATDLPVWLSKVKVGAVVCDFSPLLVPKNWQEKLAGQSKVCWEMVDAHNVVPCWLASNKQEFSARTFRPKINNLVDEYLEIFPQLRQHPYLLKPQKIPNYIAPELVASSLKKQVKVNQKIGKCDWFKTGEASAFKTLDYFLEKKLMNYSKDRNNPNLDGLSNLSPYLHFGQLAPATVVLKVKAWQKAQNSQAGDSFIEEVLVRRELAENFCYYNQNYKSIAGLPAWSQKTLGEHAQDEKGKVYQYRDFELAKTHDSAWNAAQNQLLTTGKMHGYMRMYWAKKILEWSESPDTAIKIAVKLNDLYELDGRDPNGYVGVLWSIGGLHDRPWFERKIYGKVRYMNQNGLARKFDLSQYVSRY